MPASKKHHNTKRKSLNKKIWLMYLFAFVFPPIGFALAIYMLFHLKGLRSVSLKKQIWVALFISIFIGSILSCVVYEKITYLLTPVEELSSRHGTCGIIGFYCSLSDINEDTVSFQLTNRYDFALDYVSVRVGEDYCTPANVSLEPMQSEVFTCSDIVKDTGEQILQFVAIYARNNTPYNASRTSMGQLFLFRK